VRRVARRAPRPPAAAPSTDREQILAAGVAGEQSVAAGLGRVLGADWTLLRGYRNGRGEIDHLLIGPAGLAAIESKHRNATVSCAGDRWWFVKYDNYGNQVERGELGDRRGRSPSQQLNQPAAALEGYLRGRGQDVAIERFVLLTHPRSRIGSLSRPTVQVSTSVEQVARQLGRGPAVLSAGRRAELERLITAHHQPRSRR
jgi:hypothetical protein